jgi:hypothetical protein
MNDGHFRRRGAPGNDDGPIGAKSNQSPGLAQ